MKLGIHVSNTRSAGGQIQVMLMMLSALHQANIDWEIFLISFQEEEELSKRFAKNNWKHVDVCQSLKLQPSPRVKVDNSDAIASFLRNELNLDLLLLPTWTDGAQNWGVPFIFTVHDIQHRLQPEFPEVSTGKELGASWRWREEFFSESISAARAVLVDSEEGKRNVLEYYDAFDEKVLTLPYTLPPDLIKEPSDKEIESVKRKFALPSRYAFYPAQLWPHKNHYRIVEAAGILSKREGIDIPLVFAGGDKPEWNVLDVCSALAKSYGIEKNLNYLGYVSDSELASLFAGAEMLVMPTFFGPTNIPYLEAFHHGVPVIASDLPGIREQVGEAALLVDPRDAATLAEHMKSLWEDSALRDTLREKGRVQAKSNSPGKFQYRLLEIIRSVAASLN